MPTPISGGASTAPDSQNRPRSTADGATFVGDGRLTAGWLIERHGTVFAFDFTGTFVGEFQSRAEAAYALPYVANVGGVS
jgi:hypothetical protein